MSPEIQEDRQFLALVQKIKNVRQTQVSIILLAFLSWSQDSCWSSSHHGSILCKGAKRIILEALPSDFCLHLMGLLYLQEKLENIFEMITLCLL